MRGSPADTVLTGSADELRTDTSGVEFEAPRLIPGLLASIQNVTERGGKVDEGTAAGYRQTAGTVVDAMLTDLNRIGVGDDGSLRALGDSAVMLIGEGAGDAPKADPDKLLRSAALMRRMVEAYQQRMRPMP
jgi:hypothetical protein